MGFHRYSHWLLPLLLHHRHPPRLSRRRWILWLSSAFSCRSLRRGLDESSCYSFSSTTISAAFRVDRKGFDLSCPKCSVPWSFGNRPDWDNSRRVDRYIVRCLDLLAIASEELSELCSDTVDSPDWIAACWRKRFSSRCVFRFRSIAVRSSSLANVDRRTMKMSLHRASVREHRNTEQL